ncbi:hypothetical protein PK98_11640 [Croceibacterium mercuriale]|uniref:Uncharacterized protein n=1 Tax=Croceibacterium mercuriale TaxID=1572751 RepID=A0A0B2BSS9_9SPHN|nr:hypothetical protein [Croceibacterium mercuriale]KHL24618.1 hypothetical protein PK98_11640 [Croceibacterium mercuriale]
MIRQTLPAAILVTALGTLAAPSARAAELVLTNAPGSNWIVNGTADSCQILRDLGDGEDRVSLLITQWSPGQSFFMTVAGRPLRRFSADRPVTLQFGDAAGPLGARPASVVKGSMGGSKDALIFSSARLTRWADDDPADGAGPADAARADIPPEFRMAAPKLPLAAVGLADRIELAQERTTLRLQPSRLGDALALLDNCSTQRLAEWGWTRMAIAP